MVNIEVPVLIVGGGRTVAKLVGTDLPVTVDPVRVSPVTT